MSVRHHPTAEQLEGFAAGRLDEAQRIVLATHVHHCASCRGWVRSLEHIGGTVLESLEPSRMSAGGLAQVRARLDQHAPTPSGSPSDSSSEIAGLPAFVRHLKTGAWSWIAPGIHVRRVIMEDSPSRLFFLRSKAGARFIPHSHTGTELTCVLHGGFEHDDADYGPGDIDVGMPGVDHAIHIAPGEPCISLVALSGRHTFNGFIGRIVTPLIRL